MMKVKKKQASIVFHKFSRKQMKVLTWWRADSPVKNKKGIIMHGAIRTGKTLIGSMSFIMWAMEIFDGMDFAFCGKTIGSLRRNVINTLKKVMKNRGYLIEDHRSENKLTITFKGHTNVFYLFGGKDESSQDLIQGLTLAGVFFDEVALMPLSFVDQATARCSVKGSKWWFNCNPGGPFHWFKLKFLNQKEKRNLYEIHFLMEDNPSLDEQTKQDYYNQYEGVFFLRYIKGEWVMAEGRVYDFFDNDYISTTEERVYTEFHVGIDHGVSESATVFLLLGKDIRGVWHVIKEYYYSGAQEKDQKTDMEYMQDLQTFLKGIPYKSIVVDSAAAAFITLLQRNNFRNVKKAKKYDGSVRDGISTVSNWFINNELLVNDCCIKTIQEFYTYSWDKKKAMHGKDEPKKENDHCMDALRYIVHTLSRGSAINVLTY